MLLSSLVLSTLAAQPSIAQGTGNKACGLVTESELQSTLGWRVTLEPYSTTDDVHMCGGKTESARVLLRVFTRSKDPSGTVEQAGIEAIKKMGAQVDVSTSGGIMCMTVVPPQSMAAMGFGTTCTVTSKAPRFAVIEITAQTHKDMVPMERLRRVAEKMASRF